MIKHTNGKSNKFVDVLSRVSLLLWEIKVGTLGFENLIDMYKEDVDIKYVYAAYEHPVTHNRSQ